MMPGRSGRKRSRRRPWPVFALATVVLAAGIAFQLSVHADRPPRVPVAEVAAGSLRLMSAFGPAFGGEMLAARVGLFDTEGLRLELREGSGATDPIKAVVAGADTFGVTRADAFLLARGSGAPIVAFAAGYIESPAVFYVLKGSGVQTPADFPGRKLGRRNGDDTAVAFDALTAKLALARSRISEVPVAQDLSMLLRHEVDVWPGHVGEEDYALTKFGADHVIINPAGYGIHLPGTVYFAAESTIQQHPQLVQRFLDGVVAGWEQVYADYATSVPVIAAFDERRLLPDYIRFMLDRQREYLRPVAERFGEFNDLRWRSLQNALLTQRLLTESVDLAKAVDYDFLREAYRKSRAIETETP
jgi:ABC-type nitrate/sulfonate/bicarbonate transport system substrate-binding protein